MEAQLKELLRRDNVKLWLAPYTVDGRQSGVYTKEMLVKYGREIGRSSPEVEACLETVRRKAVSRLEANKKFAKEGVATLYVSKIAVDSGAEDSEIKPASLIPVECRLGADLGADLRASVASLFSVTPEDFKLIGHAQLIEDNRLLESQGIEHGTEILCILLTEQERQSQREQQWRTSADRTRDAVKRLAKNVDLGRNHLQITDQHGNPVTLPVEEREALALAMALHEKGRKALKGRQYGQALLFLLEADKEFERCQSNILHLVDNYAILCLDVVWCYLRLESVNSLPDAERRLKLAEEGFQRSYGKNFERLAKIRRGVMHEKALIIRLQLMQGALAYYQRKYRSANDQFISVSKDIKALEVDDTKLSQLISMGYSPAEAICGLRASGGLIEAAVHRIIEEREQEELREKQRKRQHHEERIQKRFGKTPSGKMINVDTYDTIVGMGFRKRIVGEALRQADNDMNAALEILRVLPHIRSPADDLVDNIEDALFDRSDPLTEDELIAQITSLGFPVEMVNEALRLNPQSVTGAVEALLSSGHGPIQAFLDASPEFRDTIMRVAHELQEHQHRPRRRRMSRQGQGNASGGQTPEAEAPPDEDQAAYDQLDQDMSHSLHDHLDTTFEEELKVLEMLQPLVITHLK